nr:unnamed protein product [Digitaria exilis]
MGPQRAEINGALSRRLEHRELGLRGARLFGVGWLAAVALGEADQVDVAALGEAVDLTFVCVDDVGELVPAGEADGVEDGPPPCPGGDIGDPVDVADGGGGEVVFGGCRGEDDLGDPAALVDQGREDDLYGGDGVEEDEDGLAREERDGEREPARLPETMAASSKDLRVGRDAARGHQRASSAKTRSAGEGGASAQRQAVQAPRALAYHLRSRQSPMRLRRSGGRSAQRRNGAMAGAGGGGFGSLGFGGARGGGPRSPSGWGFL